MTAVFPNLAQATYPRHSLHDPARAWPETNCHTDLFVEILSTLGRDPVAGLGMTVAQDFEGDQFTFFKMAPTDLETLFGIEVPELSIYRPLVDHVEEQVARGRLVLVEVDAHFLADTAGVSYRTDHSKTTIGINRFERKGANGLARIGYFHNAGYFDAEGEDVEAMLGFGSVARPLLPPYVEFIKEAGPGLAGEALAEAVLQRFRHHLARRPTTNPVDAWRRALPAHLDWLASEPPASFHPYAFNTARQFGANVALLADHLDWLAARTGLALGGAAELCRTMTGAAKTFQFLLARALARKRFDALDAALDAIARDYDAAMAAIDAAIGSARARPVVPQRLAS